MMMMMIWMIIDRFMNMNIAIVFLSTFKNSSLKHLNNGSSMQKEKDSISQLYKISNHSIS